MSKNIDIGKKTITYGDFDGGIVTCTIPEKPLTIKIEYVKGLEARYQVWENKNTLICYDPEPDVVCISTPFLMN